MSRYLDDRRRAGSLAGLLEAVEVEGGEDIVRYWTELGQACRGFQKESNDRFKGTRVKYYEKVVSFKQTSTRLI